MAVALPKLPPFVAAVVNLGIIRRLVVAASAVSPFLYATDRFQMVTARILTKRL